MGKSLVIYVSVELEPGGDKLVATFGRYEHGRNPAYSDWMQTPTVLTAATCRRLNRIRDRGDVMMTPGRLVITRETNRDKLWEIQNGL